MAQDIKRTPCTDIILHFVYCAQITFCSTFCNPLSRTQKRSFVAQISGNFNKGKIFRKSPYCCQGTAARSINNMVIFYFIFNLKPNNTVSLISARGQVFLITWLLTSRHAVILDGTSEIGAQVRSNLCYLTFLRHLIRQKSDFFSPPRPIVLHA